MNIAVIAANGRSGQVFVKAALAAGHVVRAGVHGENHSLPKHPRLSIMQCDATNEADLTNLFQGQEAVVSFIGHVKGSPAHVQTEAIKAALRVMKTQGIRRITSLTGTGVRFKGDKIPLYDRFLNFSIGIIDPARIKDGINHVNVLKSSNSDWTVLRVLKLQDVKSSPYTLKPHGPTKLYVSREEVASATLEVLEQNSFVKEAPILSVPVSK